MDRYQYLVLMGLCVLVTLPLEVLFRARVWRRPQRLAGALAPGFVVFVGWDLWKSARGTWGFSEQYTVGLTLPGGMVVEELVFFTVIPVCALLSLETVRRILRAWGEAEGTVGARLAATARRTVLGPDPTSPPTEATRWRRAHQPTFDPDPPTPAAGCGATPATGLSEDGSA